MTLRTDFQRLAPEAIPGVRLLPVVHDRLDMGCITRLVLEELQPDAVAVELPVSLERSVMAAVDRLPRISIVISEEPNRDAQIWVCSPADPFAEALRWARERERRVFLIDPDLSAEPVADAVPDPYAIWKLGAEEYLRLLCESLDGNQKSSSQLQREGGMAYHIQQAQRQLTASLLVLLGAAHLASVSRLLLRTAAQPLARLERPNQELRHVNPRSLTAILPDPPLAHAAYEILRRGKVPKKVPLQDTVSPPTALPVQGLRVVHGRQKNARRVRQQRLAQYASRESVRRLGGLLFPDRQTLARVVWKSAAESYQGQTRETVQPWQQRLFFDFSRRYCRQQALLAGGLYEWVVAARGVGDDNLAWEVFDAARCYPWQRPKAEIPTVEVDGDLLDLGTRKIRFRRRFFRVKRRPVPVRRAETNETNSWLEGFDNPFICSYQPEDLVIEDYGRFLKQKALALLSAERKRCEPFSSSLLDGIDIRETLRNVHDGKIYVQEMGRVPGGAGSVVIIFDRDLDGTHFPHRVTWLGEHDQESDMAFYSTDPAQQVVGPGIMRATYGGLMMSYPPQRLYRIWDDPEYRRAREKAEVLLMAAVDYSHEKLVIHLAADPPSEAMHRYAARQGKRVVHIPIGSVSPHTLRKIRVVHLLAGRDKRKIASQYIW